MTRNEELGIKAPIDPKNPNYYLDKDAMRDALREHRDKCIQAEAEGKELPQVSEYLGSCFLSIAKGLGMKHNFRRYSFVNDMIMDGVMTCLKYVRSFDPDKISSRTNKPVSPLSYFTQVCWYAFINRINEEEDQAAVKWSLLLSSDIEAYSNDDEDGDFKMNLADFMLSLGPQKHLEVKEKKKKASKQSISPLDDLA